VGEGKVEGLFTITLTHPPSPILTLIHPHLPTHKKVPLTITLFRILFQRQRQQPSPPPQQQLPHAEFHAQSLQLPPSIH
jgi:hypothetical protein